MFFIQKNRFFCKEEVTRRKSFFQVKRGSMLFVKKKDFCKKKVLSCKRKCGYVKKMREEKKNIKLKVQ